MIKKSIGGQEWGEIMRLPWAAGPGRAGQDGTGKDSTAQPRTGQDGTGVSPEPAVRRSLRAEVAGGRSGSPSTGSRTGKGEKIMLIRVRGHADRACKRWNTGTPGRGLSARYLMSIAAGGAGLCPAFPIPNCGGLLKRGHKPAEVLPLLKSSLSHLYCSVCLQPSRFPEC